MPHVVVKLYAGRTEQDKIRLAEEIASAVRAVLKSDDRSISVGIEDVRPEDWAEKVYRPDILENPAIYKKPGYDPFK
jgi:4-oxalocrotonate tautomerase